MRDRTCIIDLNKKTYTKLKYKQYDNNVPIVFTIIEDSQPVDLAGYTVGAFFYRADGQIYEKNTSISGSNITATIDNNITGLSGTVKAELVFVYGETTVTSFTVYLDIEDSIDKEETIMADPQWDVIKDLLQAGSLITPTASNIRIADTANNFTATNVEGALSELFQYASNGKTLIANAITGMGVEASSADTFEELANKILLIIPTVYGNIVVDAAKLEITEGGTGTFTVCLDQAPTNSQKINITSDNSKVTVSPSTLTFTPSNYNNAQTVTVSAEDDDIEDNGYTLKLTLSSNNVESILIDITVKDNDLVIEWHTVTVDEMETSKISSTQYVWSIASTEPNLILPSTIEVDGSTVTPLYSVKLNSISSTLKRLKVSEGLQFHNKSISDICADCSNLSRIEIECDLNGITSAVNSFKSTALKDLSNVTLPNTLTNISSMCRYCSELEKAPVIPASITSASFAFQSCKKLKKVTIESKALKLNDSTTGVEPFNDCNGITIKCYNDSQFYSDMRKVCTNPVILDKYYYEPLGSDTVTNIHCFGDSLTQGVNGSSGYPTALLELLGTDYWVYNMSKAGYTTEQIGEMIEPQLCHVKDNMIIWSGSNDGSDLTESERVAKVQTLVDKVPVGVNYLVIGLITYEYTDAVNEAFRSAFGEHFLDMHTALCSEDAFTNIGETATEDDLTDIANGTLPRSLIATQHMTSMGDKAVAKIIYDKLISNNYISI